MAGTTMHPKYLPRAFAICIQIVFLRCRRYSNISATECNEQTKSGDLNHLLSVYRHLTHYYFFKNSN